MNDLSEIVNTLYQWHGDDIQDILRGMIRSQLGGYYSANHKYLLNAKPNDTFVLLTPPISSFEQDCHFDYYLDKSRQPLDAQATDVFDELMPLLNQSNKASVKILFSFNINNLHWTTCEIHITKTNKNYTIHIYSHDTYGGGKMPSNVFNCLEKAIKKRIKNFHEDSIVKLSNDTSPCTARQNPADGTSCGLISAIDIIRCIKGESISQLSTYSIGAPELRQYFLSQLDHIDISEICKQRIRQSNTLLTPVRKNKIKKKTSQNTTFMPINEESSTSYTSSEDSSSEKFEFNHRYFENEEKLPFEIKTKKAGKVKMDSLEDSSSSEESSEAKNMSTSTAEMPGYVLNIPALANGSKNRLIEKIKSVLLPEAFHSTAEKSLSETTNRIRINIGFNKMESISKKKNRALEKTVHFAKEKIDDNKTKAFGFFWTPHWFDKITKRQTTIKRVRAWYKTIKRKKPAVAKLLVDQLESQITSDMIPYTQIREKIKNHKKTKSLIRKLRSNHDIGHVYLTSFDDDFVSLRYAEIGLFSEYDRLISEHESAYGEPPQVLSTGYLVSSMHMPMIEVAVKLDMVVRQATSTVFKNAVYYNEPNTIIYVNPNDDTVEASFLSQGDSCKNEMPTLMANLIKKRSLNPNDSFVFYSSNAPLLTNMPVRMQAVSKKSNRKVFTGQKTKDGKILRFNYHDLQMLIKTSQSHVVSRDWANRIISCLTIPENKTIDKVNLTSSDIGYALQSLVARLFTVYNPIYTAQARFDSGNVLVNKVNNYIYHLEYVCSNYYQTLVLKKGKPGKSREKLTNKNIIAFRQELDELTSIDILVQYIGRLLNDHETARKIQRAAQFSGNAICEELLRSLSFDFPRMIYAMLTDLLNTLDDRNCCEYDELHENTKSTLESLADNSFVEKFSKKMDHQLKDATFEYDLNVLHLAVLSGNKTAVKFLLEKGFLLDTATDNDGILPLHFAILYCANHGNDLELINLCLLKKIINKPLKNKFTPLMMALTMLDDPLPVVSVLCQQGALDEKLHQPLYTVLLKTKGRELRTPLLACIHYLPHNTELAKAMVLNGADVNQRGIIESKAYGQELEKQFTYPLCECITGENIQLLDYLLKNKTLTTEIYDSEGRPPLIIAIHDTSHPIFFVKPLLQYNADLSESDLIEGTYPLHESISPLHSRYLAPGPNKQKYLDAFMETLRNLGQNPPKETSLFDYILNKSTPYQLELRDGNDDTALQVALEIEDDEIISKLIFAGADTDYLEREECQYIRQNTDHEIFHSEELEEQADQENMDLAEDVFAEEGIDLDTSDSDEIIRGLNALISNEIDDPVETLFKLKENLESDAAEEDSSEGSSSSYHIIVEELNVNPSDFKYEDEENLDEDEVDYPDAPLSSNSQSPVPSYNHSYEMSDYSS